MQAGAGNRTLRHALAEELIRYTMTHFAAEEAAMEAYGYPALDEHRREHGAAYRPGARLRQPVPRRSRGNRRVIARFPRDLG